MSPKKEAPAPEGVAPWLEEQLQQGRVQIQRLEHRLEEVVHQLQTLMTGSRKVEEGLSASSSQVALLPILQEEMRRVKDQMGRLQDRLAAEHNRAEELARQRRAELERERQERAGLAKRIDAIEKVNLRHESRLQAVDDALRHGEEEAASLRQAQQHLSQALEEPANKANRSVEALARVEQQLSHLVHQVEALGQAGEALSDQVKLAREVVRRAEERVDRMEQHLPAIDALQEQYNSLRAEREGFSERIAKLERDFEEAKELAAQMNHLLEIVRQRTEQQGVQLLALAEEMRQQGQQVREQLRRAFLVLERQKRRQAEALGQEIKELRQGDLTLNQP